MFKVGDKIRILNTDTNFLKGSIGEIGIVVKVNENNMYCLVTLVDNYGSSKSDRWFYQWDELEVIK